MGSIRVDKPGLNPGLTLPFHMAINHCIRVASYSVKDGVCSLGLPSYRSSLYYVAAKKVCGTSALTSDYRHGLGSV